MMNRDAVVHENRICAWCGAVIRPDWIIDDIICPACNDQLNAAGPSWCDSPCGKLVIENGRLSR